jgi:hypothetical protein
MNQSVYYSEKFGHIRIIIIYSQRFQKFRISIEKDDIEYIPKETDLQARTWECMFQKLEAETRTAAFMNFVGIPMKKTILNAIQANQKRFIKCV